MGNRALSSVAPPNAATVLPCDASSISFDSDERLHVSSPETLDALNKVSHYLTHEHEPVALPTETVYGLGANALNTKASSRIFSVKGRPPDNPLIVHVSSSSMLASLLPSDYQIPPIYRLLMEHFWPGPLTLLFPTNPKIIPSIITANQPTVAIRMPSNPIARALISVADVPIAAPSANSSGKPSPTRAEHVLRDIGGKIRFILDGGPCDVGLESTVVDGLHEDGNLRVLRPGGLPVEEIERVLQMQNLSGPVPKVLVHRRDFTDALLEQAPTTPGMKYRHYSPSIPVILLMTSKAPDVAQCLTPSALIQQLQDKAVFDNTPKHVGLLMPSDSSLFQQLTPFSELQWNHFSLGSEREPAVMAQRLFDGLLTLEERGVDLILIQGIDEAREGLAFMNRVIKAAGETRWIALG